MKRKPINRPISYLPMFVTALEGDLSTAQEQYETLIPVKDKPSVLTDDIVNRIITLHEEKNEFIENYERQFKIWRKGKLSASQLEVITDLENKLPQLKETNDKVLKLAYEIQPYTIDKIMAMDPIELSMLHLSEKLKGPFGDADIPK